jgi:hypothetical protein
MYSIHHMVEWADFGISPGCNVNTELRAMRQRSARECGRQVECPYRVAGRASYRTRLIEFNSSNERVRLCHRGPDMQSNKEVHIQYTGRHEQGVTSGTSEYRQMKQFK